LILYLAGNAVTGRQGLVSYMRLQQRERALRAEQGELAADAARLRARIHALADSSLDLDALEDEASRQIGAAPQDAVVIDLAQNGGTFAR
jgi:cell division protein FtsB